MTQGTKRLTEELHRLEGLKLREILDEMAATGSPTVVLSFNGTQGKPVAAVALITGPDTADRVEALEKPLSRVAVPQGWTVRREPAPGTLGYIIQSPNGKKGSVWQDDADPERKLLALMLDTVAARQVAMDTNDFATMCRDARRYQWLREPDNFGSDQGDDPSGWDQLCELAGADFDAFIDARMEQDQGVSKDA